jgi:hypothetical protein
MKIAGAHGLFYGTALFWNDLNLVSARGNRMGGIENCIHAHRWWSAMIRFLLRTLGLLFLAAAFIFLVYDGTKSIAADTLLYSKVDEIWSLVHTTSLQQLQPSLEKNAPPWLWDPVVTTVLDAPAVVVFGIAGAILILLGRRKKPLIGYGR